MSKPNPSRWPKGKSGNPSGRPNGVSNTREMRAQLGDKLPEILSRIQEAALNGDMTAARLIVDRVLPARKAEEMPISLDIPKHGTLSEKAEAIIQAVAEGAVAPSQGSQLITALGAMARIIEVEQLEQRISALERGGHER